MFNNQEILKFVIISFILVTLIIDSRGDTVGRKKMLVTLTAEHEIAPNTGANATKFFTLVTKS